MTKGNFKLRVSLSSLRICRSKKSSSSTSPVAHNPNKSFEIIAYPKLPPPPPPPSTPDHPLSKRGLCRVLSFGSSDSECGSYKFIIRTGHVTSACSLDSSSPAYNMGENYDGFREKLCNSPAEAEAGVEAAYSSEDIHDLDQEESLILWPIDHPLKTETNISRDPNREISSIYAVMKKSTDPYEDFKKSMTEMIVEKEIFQPEELQKLLMCFLSLNAHQHRVAIVEAFTQVWEELFC